MTRTQIARIAAMLKNNIDTAVSQRHLTEADAIARIARNLAVELADISASFRFHSFYAACGLTTDGYRPLNLGTPPRCHPACGPEEHIAGCPNDE